MIPKHWDGRGHINHGDPTRAALYAQTVHKDFALPPADSAQPPFEQLLNNASSFTSVPGGRPPLQKQREVRCAALQVAVGGQGVAANP